MHVEVITTTSFSIVSIFPSFSKLAFFDAILSCNNELITLPSNMRDSFSAPGAGDLTRCFSIHVKLMFIFQMSRSGRN